MAALQMPLGCELASLPDPKAEGDFCQQVSGVSLELSRLPLPVLHDLEEPMYTAFRRVLPLWPWWAAAHSHEQCDCEHFPPGTHSASPSLQRVSILQ